MKKKILSGVLAFVLLFGSAAALPEGTFGESTSIIASAEVSDDYDYTKLADGTVQIDSYNGGSATVKIPSMIKKMKVTKIKDAFYGNNTITSVTIPDTVTEIGEDAFYSCSNLKSVTLPSALKTIGETAFGNCLNLTGITLPSKLETIGNYAFYKCKALKSVTLPKSVKTIGDHAFEYCDLLKSITLSEGITTIGTYAFYGCPSLKTVSVPKSVTSIGSSAFGRCYDASLDKDTNVKGFVLKCYFGSKAEEYAANADMDYKLIDSQLLEKSGAKKISNAPFSQLGSNGGIYANEKNNGLYVLSDSVLYFISAATAKTSKVYDFSSVVSDSINNSYVCGNKLYAVGSRYQNGEVLYSIYIYNLDTKKLIKRISTKIAVTAVAANAKGNIFVSDDKKIYMLTAAGKKVSEVSFGEHTVYRFTGYDETNGNLYFEGYLNYIYWGYDHATTSLFSANAENNKLTFNSKYIDAFYQHGVSSHNCSSVLLDGRYLAYTCRFMSLKVGLIDSNKFDLTKDSAPYMFGVERDDIEKDDDYGYDSYSYGVRTEYIKGNDSFVIYVNGNTMYEYDKKANQISKYNTLTHVYSMNKIGNNIIADGCRQDDQA